jgi:hypothetical protein
MFRKLIKKQLKVESGAVLMQVLFFMLIAALIIVPALWATSTMLTVNLDALNHTSGYYAAKSGIEDVYYKFKDADYSFSSYFVGSPVNGMTVKVEQIPGTTVTIDGTKKTYPLQSTASVPGGSVLSTVYSSMEVDHTGGYPFRYAVATTGGDLDLSTANIEVSSPNSKADVFANGKLTVSTTGSTSVTGHGYYTTTPAPDCSKVTYGCQYSDPVVLQAINEQPYLDEANIGKRYPDCGASCPTLTLPLDPPYGTGTYTASNVTLGSKAGPGYISYINGNLVINNNVTIKGTVWVNGNIDIYGTVTTPGYGLTTAPYQNYFVSHGSGAVTHSINFHGGARIRANYDLSFMNDNGGVWSDNNVRGPGGANDPALLGVIYAPNGAVDLSNNVRAILGAIIGQSVKLSNNVTVHYNEDYQNNPITGFMLNQTSVTVKNFSSN